jgi:hypothetical protein
MAMKKRFFFFPVLFLIIFTVPVKPVLGQTEEEVNGKIVSAISTGNTEELGKYFNSMVDLNIPGIEDSFSKTQAVRILHDFFSRYPVKSYKINKTGNSKDGSQFSIGKLEAGSKSFRVFYLIKKISDQYLVHQFQIQEEK